MQYVEKQKPLNEVHRFGEPLFSIVVNLLPKDENRV